MMFMCSIFPSELLKGRLKLIHKSGDADIENFHGLTLLPAVSKVFEILLFNQLVEYLNSRQFLCGYQYGFRKKSSCIGAAHQLLDFVKANFKKGSGKRKMYVGGLSVR